MHLNGLRNPRLTLMRSTSLVRRDSPVFNAVLREKLARVFR